MVIAVRGLLSFVFFIISTFFFATSASAFDQYALIYSGPTTCEGCPEAIADVARKAKLSVKYVSNPKRIPKLLKDASIFIIGGTEDNIEPMRLAFDENVVGAIKAYLNQGGRYLGVCGGGFIAAAHYSSEKNVRVRGFDIIPAVALDYSDTREPHLEAVSWNKKRVTLYFQGGPKFILDKNAKNIDIIARYSNGDIAALSYLYGKGKVIVIGPHPEADRAWLEDDGINAAHWKSEQGLLVDLLK